MRVFQKAEAIAARRDLFLQMVDESDPFTGKTGLSLVVQMVKAGGSAYAAVEGSVTEIGSGTYRIRLAVADLDTDGEAMLRITATGALHQFVPICVVDWMDEIHLAKAALVNRREHTVATGVDVIKDDDGVTTLRTLTPDEVDGVVVVMPG